MSAYTQMLSILQLTRDRVREALPATNQLRQEIERNLDAIEERARRIRYADIEVDEGRRRDRLKRLRDLIQRPKGGERED